MIANCRRLRGENSLALESSGSKRKEGNTYQISSILFWKMSFFSIVNFIPIATVGLTKTTRYKESDDSFFERKVFALLM